MDFPSLLQTPKAYTRHNSTVYILLQDLQHVVWCSVLVMWSESGVVLNHQYKVQQLKLSEYLHLTCSHIRSESDSQAQGQGMSQMKQLEELVILDVPYYIFTKCVNFFMRWVWKQRLGDSAPDSTVPNPL
jgi:hypothetical protein